MKTTELSEPDQWAQEAFGREYRPYDDTITNAVASALEWERLLPLANDFHVRIDIANQARAYLSMARQFLNSERRKEGSS